MTQNELAYQANKIKEAEMETGKRRADIEAQKVSVARDELDLKKNRQGWDIAANMIGSIGSAVGSAVGAFTNPAGRIVSAGISSKASKEVANIRNLKGGNNYGRRY